MKKMKHYIGKISSIKDNIIYCSNIKSSPYIGEVVNLAQVSTYNDSQQGVIFETENNSIKILLIKGSQQKIHTGYLIYGTSNTVRVRVGFNILGKTITPFGDLICNNIKEEEGALFLDKLYATEYRYISNTSPSIIHRKKVSKPFLTGINVIDCLFPIGLGQRQLIIGDNNTGKTSLSVSAIINQRRNNQFTKIRYDKYVKQTNFKPCIYVSIGQQRSEVIRIQQVLKNFNCD